MGLHIAFTAFYEELSCVYAEKDRNLKCVYIEKDDRLSL